MMAENRRETAKNLGQKDVILKKDLRFSYVIIMFSRFED